jgi:hypothetical protein
MSEHVLTDTEAEAMLTVGATYRDIPRLAWPDLTDQEADRVLWECTPFPLVDGVHDLADAVAAAFLRYGDDPTTPPDIAGEGAGGGERG